MSGYLRQGLPNTTIDQTTIKAPLIAFIGEEEIASVMRALDPFQVDDLCTLSPSGAHVGIGSCGEVVCRHCAKAFWR